MIPDLIDKQIKLTKAAVMGGRPQEALDGVEHLVSLLKRDPPDEACAETLQARMAELRGLAQAALAGAQSAAAQMQAIIHSARSLETYDQQGKRKVADTAAAQPRRF
ncbi:hypothetical protein [Paracoccus tegillarcae]|uniref:Uncharacterized protein n=1 Tax=Paracoccus tegillarcae TaxID=1529068 RepID=A0A2K9EEL7_9RHOB|nr:hypothetical protein [Paracoccus tegillarcae]AUH33400.1 hypothetical protein CUV01_08350 [Paracoccus tegillarcae]